MDWVEGKTKPAGMPLARWLAGFVLMLMVSTLGAIPTVVLAAAPDAIEILLSDDAPYYRETEAALRLAFARNPGPVPVTRSLADGVALEPPPNTWFVAIGTHASVWAGNRYPDQNVVSVLVSRQGLEDQLASHQGRGRRAAVVIDQPADRALRLGLLLKPDSKHIGAVFGPGSQAMLADFSAAVASKGRILGAANIATGDNPVATLTPVVERSDLFIAIPDREAFNRAVAKWILYLCFRRKIPVIGFSQSYNEVGALASVFSTPENIGRQAGELLIQLTEGSEPALWAIHQPKYYTLKTSPSVARALGIALPDEATLYRLYSAALAAPP